MYRERVGVQVSELDEMNNESVKRKVYEWESNRWNEERVQLVCIMNVRV